MAVFQEGRDLIEKELRALRVREKRAGSWQWKGKTHSMAEFRRAPAIRRRRRP